jgi:hypothetical protein
MNFIAVGLIVLVVVANLAWALSFEDGIDGAPGFRALPTHESSDEGATSLETSGLSLIPRHSSKQMRLCFVIATAVADMPP